MSSTGINIGFNDNAKASSRVLKPPGGGPSNIFSSEEVKPIPVRPKYNQQNSSNLNDIMGTNDHDITTSNENHQPQQNAAKNESSSPTISQTETKTGTSNDKESNNSPASGVKVRVPPGGFSSGLW